MTIFFTRAKFIAFLALWFEVSTAAWAQNSWMLAPSGTTQDLHAIDYSYMVGDSGTLIKTTDIGLTWTALNSGTTKDLYGLVGCGSGCFYFCGDSGAVSRALAFGNTIEPHDIQGRVLPLWDIAIQGSDQPLVVGDSGYFGRSNNFGTNFTQYTTGTEEHLYGISGFGLSYRLAVGAGGTILRSDDVGITWNAVSSGTGQDLYDVYGQQSVAAIAVGANGTILRSEIATNGTVWSTIASPVSTHLNAVARDGLGGVIMAVGDGGVIIRSTDDGLTWTQLVSGTIEDLNDVFPWSGSAWLVAGANGTILRSTDGGGSGVGLSEWEQASDRITVTTNDGRVVVSFDTDQAGVATLRMLDVAGREVMTAHRFGIVSGRQQVQLPLPVSPGTYVVQLQHGERRMNQRIVNPGQ